MKLPLCSRPTVASTSAGATSAAEAGGHDNAANTRMAIAARAARFRQATNAALDRLRNDLPLEATPPDLAVLDIKMPRMDGMDLLQRLRQKTTMPVIFLTSKDDEIDEVLGLRMGAAALLSIVVALPVATVVLSTARGERSSCDRS